MEILESISTVTLDLTDLCSVYSNSSIFSATLSEKDPMGLIPAHLVAFRPELSLLSNDDLNNTLPKSKHNGILRSSNLHQSQSTQ